jgi:magnesium-transporting ATPase (P-type)
MRIYMQRILRVVKTLSHPVPLITFFLIFPIIPGRWDGIYLHYIFDGIRGIKFYAFTAVAGIGVLLYSLVRYKRKNYFDREVLKAKCKWAWYNTVGLMLIGFSLASFYHLDETPSFRESIENDYFFLCYLLFIQMCRLFLAFNIGFVIFSAMDNEKAKSDYYDEDEYYGDLNDLDDYEEI